MWLHVWLSSPVVKRRTDDKEVVGTRLTHFAVEYSPHHAATLTCFCLQAVSVEEQLSSKAGKVTVSHASQTL